MTNPQRKLLNDIRTNGPRFVYGADVRVARALVKLGSVVLIDNGPKPDDHEQWWCMPITPDKTAPSGITKLPSVIGKAKKNAAEPLVITPESKAKLQKLNRSLSNFMFGRNK